MKGKRGLRVAILFPVVIVAGILIAWVWITSDISGEYTFSDQRKGTVTMSIVRKATSVSAELSVGRGALLEAHGPYTSQGDPVSWTFSVPRYWVDRGKASRSVGFQGKIENGFVTGTLDDGSQTMDIKLERNGIASIYRMFQSHLPWVG